MRNDSMSPSRIRSATTAVCTRSPRYFGKHDSPADRADLVPGPADPLQAARDARRRLDLDHEVDRAHVDAELEAARRDHRRQAAGLEVLLDEGALLLGHRAVVGPREDRGGAAGGPRLTAMAAAGAAPVSSASPVCALDPDLVEPGGEPLGEATRVGEHDRRAVRRDEVDDALLHVRPDRRALRVAGSGAVDLARRRAHLGHVVDRDDHLEVERLGASGCTTVTGRAPPRNDATSSTGRTVADRPMRCAGWGSRASSRSRERARWAPRFVPATRVHLVDDHGLTPRATRAPPR